MTHPTTSPEVPHGLTSEAPLRRLPLMVWIGLAVSLAAAAVASWAALYWVAHATGWRVIHLSLIGRSIDTAHLLPASVDIAAVSAGWVWLRCNVTDHARAYAMYLTYGATTLSLIGNATGHLIQEGVVSGEWWPVIVAVGAVPAVMVVALVHLAALCSAPLETPEPVREAPQVTSVEVSSVDFPATETPQVSPTPEPRRSITRTLKPRPKTASREAVVLDILDRAKTPEDVPLPAQIMSDWAVSRPTAGRIRAEVLERLTPTRQEA